MAGCQNDQFRESPMVDLSAGFEVELESIVPVECPETKTYADEDHLVVWHYDDRISVFEKKDYREEYRYTGRTGTIGGRLLPVSGDGSVTGDDLDYYYAVYPHSELNGFDNSGRMLLTIPKEQPYDEFSFGRGTNLMVSASEDNAFKFKNIGGYLVFKLYGEGISVSSIRLAGKNGEILTGDVDVVVSPGTDPEVAMSTASDAEKYDEAILVCDPPVALGATAEDFKEFWFVLPPVTLNGYSIEVMTSDGKVWTKSTDKVKTISRNHYSPVSVMEVEIEPESTLPIPEAVDMGLSVKWASFNLGASSPQEEGEYYAWGEVIPKERYAWDTYKWFDGTDNTLKKYNSESNYGLVDNKYVLDLEDDAVRSALGSDWRIPSTKEWEELVDPNNCDWTWTAQNGVDGYLVTSKRTENSIFIPAAGHKSYEVFYPFYGTSYYWLNELIDPNDARWSKTHWDRFSDKASAGSVRQDRRESYWSDRYSGQPIRPVMDVIDKNLICDDHLDLWEGYTRLLSVKSLNGYGLSFLSKDESIITVDNNGILHAVGIGTATVRVSTLDEVYSAYCSVTVYPAPEIIDLGLSVKWASFNVGAKAPEEAGYQYAWGETAPKSTYSWAKYKWCNGTDHTLTKYNSNSSFGTIDNKHELDDEDDVAKLWSNGQWRMPTIAELEELYANCDVSNDGNWNTTYTSRINGNTIYFPRLGNSFAIWSSELEINGDDFPNFAMCLAVGGLQSSERYGGLNVRAVLVE